MRNEEELDREQPVVEQVVVAKKRSLVVAYLSYALEDVRAVSPTSLYLLQMTINSLKQDDVAAHRMQ